MASIAGSLRCYGKLPELQAECSRPKADCITKIMECANKADTGCSGKPLCQCVESSMATMAKCASDCTKELNDTLASPLCKPVPAPPSSASNVLDPCISPGAPKPCSGNGACRTLSELPLVQAAGYSNWESKRVVR